MKYKWTILFLVHAAGRETRQHAMALFSVLKNTKYNEEIKVLVLFGGPQSSVEYGYQTQVVLKEVIKDKLTGRLDFSQVQPSYGNINIGDDKKLSVIFSFIRNEFPSERFLLFTWDHGSGFGIFKMDPRKRGLFDMMNFEIDFMNGDDEREIGISLRDLQFEVVDHNRNDSADDEDGARGVGNKETKTSMLTNDGLRRVIKHDDEKGRVDLLIMMNCAMQMIETGYAFRGAVEYLVAAETCIFWAGYNYKGIINKLCTEPDLETAAIGKYVLDTMREYYENTPCSEYFNDLVVSMVKPGEALKVKATIDDIAGMLKHNLYDSFPVIKNARERCEDLTGKYITGSSYQYIDFLNYISENSFIGEETLKMLKLVTRAYVSHIMKGANYNEMNGRDNTGQVNGFTIYFPLAAADAYDDIYYEWFYKSGSYQTSFAAESEWRKFLIDYFKIDKLKQNE